jgi:hypothetical protein
MGLVVSSVLWDANSQSQEFSRVYTDEWALRLFNGFRRNLTVPHRSVLFTDRLRDLPPFIDQIVQPDLGSNGYGDCVRPFILDEPMIFTGLDTVITGNCDKLARYCLESDKIALPKHPYEPYAINGVVLTPGGHRRIFDEWRGENDMKWMRRWPHNLIDTLWPGRVISYKASVRNRAFPNKACIIYFHGNPKMQDLSDEAFIKRHWI